MGSTDTYLVEKLKEILLRLHLPTIAPNSEIQQENNIILKNSVVENIHPVIEDINNIKSLYGFPKKKHESESDLILKRNLNEFIQALKISLSSSGTTSNDSFQSSSTLLNHKNQLILPIMTNSASTSSSDYEFNLTDNDINNLNHLMSSEETGSMAMKHIIIIGLYICIAFIAIVGNLLVVELVIRSRRLHTLTHALLANLAVADLFMAGLNIPFSISRVVLTEWPFGSFLCHAIPFVQVTSVYVTSITMASIALDRYQVIMNPLGRRMKSSEGAFLVFVIWILSGILSLPYAINHKVVTILTVKIVQRCQADFESIQSRQLLTIGTFFTQYLIPLIITSISYYSIMHRLGQRTSGLGSTTPRQIEAQSRGKRTTIKMLVLTVIFFAVCWAPINIYHLLTHFTIVRHNSTAILLCHLIAMSSTCYNPFIYCWLNEHFRLEALKWLKCFRTKRSPTVYPGIEVNGVLTRNDFYLRTNQSNINNNPIGRTGTTTTSTTTPAPGSMSFRSQQTRTNISNIAPDSTTNTINNQQMYSSSLQSNSSCGRTNRNFMTRLPRGIFPPELLFLTRPSIIPFEETTDVDDDEELENEDNCKSHHHLNNDSESQNHAVGNGTNINIDTLKDKRVQDEVPLENISQSPNSPNSNS